MTVWRDWLPVGCSLTALIASLLLVARTTHAPVTLPPLPSAVHVYPQSLVRLRMEIVHPAFAPSRSIAAVGSGAIVPAAPPPILTGIASGGGKALALVKTQKGETAILRVGDIEDGWTVVSIGDRQATFERAGERRVGALVFGSVPVAKKTDAVSP